VVRVRDGGYPFQDIESPGPCLRCESSNFGNFFGELSYLLVSAVCHRFVAQGVTSTCRYRPVAFASSRTPPVYLHKVNIARIFTVWPDNTIGFGDSGIPFDRFFQVLDIFEVGGSLFRCEYRLDVVI